MLEIGKLRLLPVVAAQSELCPMGLAHQEQEQRL